MKKILVLVFTLLFVGLSPGEVVKADVSNNNVAVDKFYCNIFDLSAEITDNQEIKFTNILVRDKAEALSNPGKFLIHSSDSRNDAYNNLLSEITNFDEIKISNKLVDGFKTDKLFGKLVKTEALSNPGKFIKIDF